MTPKEAMRRRLKTLARHLGKLKGPEAVIQSERWLLPWPGNVKHMAKVLGGGADSMADALSRDITEGVALLVDPVLQQRVLARKDLVTRWPLFMPSLRAPDLWDAGNPWVVLWALKLADLVPQQLNGIDWLPDVAPADVARWVSERVPAGFRPRWEWLAEMMAQRSVRLPALGWNLDCFCEGEWPPHTCYCEGEWRVVPPGGLALLYQAERDARPKPFSHLLIPADRPPVRACTALHGAHPKDRGAGSVTLDTDRAEPVVTFRWDDGTCKQLELPYHHGASPLAEIRQKYGDTAVRDLLAYAALTWAARAPAGRPVWVYHDELLELCGLAVNKDNRKAAKERLTRLSKTAMTVSYGDRRKLRGPLVQTSYEALQVERGSDVAYATVMALHPALFQGVTDEVGHPGSHWWPSPIGFVGAPATGGVHVLGVVLGYYWRGALPDAKGEPPVACVRMDTLADVLGIDRARRREGKDSRAADTICRALDDSVTYGLVKRWWPGRGDMDSLGGVVMVEPALVGPVQAPAWVPDTGAALSRFMGEQGLSGAKLARLVGVSKQLVSRSAATPHLPILPGLRRALRLYLRGG